jgi:hypothetical protein
MAEKRQLPTLYVVQIGNDEFERYLIRDQEERVWTGEQFDAQGAALFARHNDAAVEAQHILKRTFDGVEPQRFVVPLYVEVLSHAGPVPVAEIAEYLSRGSRLYLDTTENGNGPGDALVLPRIEWHRIEQIKEFPDA